MPWEFLELYGPQDSWLPGVGILRLRCCSRPSRPGRSDGLRPPFPWPLSMVLAPACCPAATVACQRFILGPRRSITHSICVLGICRMERVSWPVSVCYSPCVCPFSVARRSVPATGWPPLCLPSWIPRCLPSFEPGFAAQSWCPWRVIEVAVTTVTASPWVLSSGRPATVCLLLQRSAHQPTSPTRQVCPPTPPIPHAQHCPRH